MTEGDNLTSAVIPFRLSWKNPREKRALEYLQRKKAEGIGPRQVIAEALVRMADQEDTQAELVALQREALEILRKLESGVSIVTNGEPASQAAPGGELTETFKRNLRKIARPVMKPEDVEED